MQAELFVETGTAYGDSSYYVASNFPSMNVHTNEPDTEKFNLSKSILGKFPNVNQSATPSPEFFNELWHTEVNLFNLTTVFWLDAHGDWLDPDGKEQFSWPLPKEVELITQNFKRYYIFIDDFYNPWNKAHKFDIYLKQRLICGPDMVRPYLNGAKMYHLNHQNVTSKQLPQIIGVGLITNMPLLPFADQQIVENQLEISGPLFDDDPRLPNLNTYS